ncbi:hypothetical protein SISNIDRAFT_485467 [Sistotremastrum niveocremeum HHB9708]|uniref:Uncharacterized protein n=2 Tax=Sistotremastraceae TaxID=3402574 RepID=A0A164V6V0_9AGAM|nr:hypothetical protein SISNIDRAFT_485467 [Sistotremastrum niveocremeum HHB9708]KZT36436.1 hypothetical protein SISSUDRAFT_1063657 [Sistotremastrum suecicum HHB10207 ss-3]
MAEGTIAYIIGKQYHLQVGLSRAKEERRALVHHRDSLLFVILYRPVDVQNPVRPLHSMPIYTNYWLPPPHELTCAQALSLARAAHNHVQGPPGHVHIVALLC